MGPGTAGVTSLALLTYDGPMPMTASSVTITVQRGVLAAEEGQRLRY